MSILPATVFAADIVASGYCGGEGDGTDLTWKLDSEGVLTISGTGAMRNTGGSNAPWFYYSFEQVIIEDGIITLMLR